MRPKQMDRMQDGAHCFCGRSLKIYNLFLLYLFPFPIGLQKDAVKETKIKGKGGGSHPRFQREGSIPSAITKLKYMGADRDFSLNPERPIHPSISIASKRKKKGFIFLFEHGRS